jgi:4-amino-4-deoxy-L-arabinose transferase-like glycosyltransferase
MGKKSILLFAIIILGIAVRVAGIDFGLPLLCHNDESVIVNYALAYGKGDFNPHFFKVPPLMSYMLFFLYGIFFVVGKISGMFSGVTDFGYRFLSDPTAFYLIGRLFCGVFFGVLAIPLIYKLGKKVFNERTGILAALFLSINFLHVRNSHYIYFDIPLVFFILLFLVVLHALFKKNRLNQYLTCGFILGVAVSVKYSAIVLLFPAVLISIINIFRLRENASDIIKKNLAAGFAVTGGMFMSNPYMFVDYAFFLDTISRMPFFRPPFWFHLKVSLVEGCGFLMCVAALCGSIISLIRRNVFSAVLLSFFICYYLILTGSSQLAERYVFPVLPVVLLMTAYCVDTIISKARRKKTGYFAGVILCGAMMLPSALKVYYSDRLFMEKDIRQVFYEWVVENIPPGTKIALDATGELTSILPQKRQLLKESFDNFTNPKFEVPQQSLEYKIKLILNNPYTEGKEYHIFYIKTRPSKDRFLKSYPEIYMDIKTMKELGVEYIILNKLLLWDKKDTLFLRDLERESVPVMEFSPYKETKFRILPEEKTVVPAAAFSFEELKDRKRFGPVIRVYKLKKQNKERK